jgi:hypothetical protein
MYSGERFASLNAVLANIAYARRLPLAPIEASRFSRIAQGVLTTAFEPMGPRAWRVRNRGALQTIRFDDAAATGVDFERSLGVIGQRHDLGSLYVALDEQEDTPIVMLKTVVASASEPVASVPYLVESRWRIMNLARSREQIRFRAQGFGAGDITWRWPHAEDAIVSWRAASGRAGVLRIAPSAQGLLELHLPQLTAQPVEIDITIAKGSHG